MKLNDVVVVSVLLFYHFGPCWKHLNGIYVGDNLADQGVFFNVTGSGMGFSQARSSVVTYFRSVAPKLLLLFLWPTLKVPHNKEEVELKSHC